MSLRIVEGKIWTREEIRNLIETNDEMVGRCLVKLYNCQTADEQAIGCTRHNNGVGFNGADSQLLSSLAQYFITRKILSSKQLFIARKKIKKYIGQLTRIANGEQ